MTAHHIFRSAAVRTFAVWLSVIAVAGEPEQQSAVHPRLYLTADELPNLRASRNEAPRDAIWQNLRESADWCAAQPVRSDWIPTNADDPQFENLYPDLFTLV